MPTTERVFQIFKELNQIPRPSHHEERVADYLCQFAERLHLPYKRDKENCVVISKPCIWRLTICVASTRHVACGDRSREYYLPLR